MSVALLLITHDTIGSSLLETATNMLGICPIATENLPVTQHCKPEQLLTRAKRLCYEIDQGNGILIMTDMYGSTPSNIALKLLTQKDRILVTGVNLPMLIRVMNYAKLNLTEIAEKAASGAADSIFIMDNAHSEHKQKLDGF